MKGSGKKTVCTQLNTNLTVTGGHPETNELVSFTGWGMTSFGKSTCKRMGGNLEGGREEKAWGTVSDTVAIPRGR